MPFSIHKRDITTTLTHFWLEDVGSASVYGRFSHASACYGFTTMYVFFSIYDCRDSYFNPLTASDALPNYPSQLKL